MTNDKHRLRRKTLTVIAVSVIVSAVLLGLLYAVGTHRCLEKTLGFGQETMAFLENACEKCDRYEQGRKTSLREFVWVVPTPRAPAGPASGPST